MFKKRNKYKFHIVRKDTGGIIYTSTRTFRNSKKAWKQGTWFAMYYGFTIDQVAIAIETIKPE